MVAYIDDVHVGPRIVHEDSKNLAGAEQNLAALLGSSPTA